MALIAHYKLDGNSLDSSGNGNHGTILNSPTLVTGKLGNAYKFKSQPDGISIPNNFLLVNFTMSAWINPAGNHYNYDGAILSSGNWNSSHWSFGVKQNNSGFSCRGMGASPVYAFTLNTWHFILCKREGTNTKIFVDGEQLWEGTSSSNIPLTSNASNTCIGRETYAGGYFGFNGSIDDVRIYDHALSDKEIQELAKAKVLHYTFDDFQEPTTNLAYTNGTADFNFSNLGTTITSSIIHNNWKYRISAVTAGTFRWLFNYTKLINGATYNLSFKYNTLQGLISFSDWCDSSTTVSISNGFATAYGSRSEYNSTYRFMDMTIGSNTIVDIWDIQLEKKDHATPFTISSRPGSITDISGQDNHAELTEATTPTWTNDSRIGNGAYEWNGTASNYIVFPHASIGLPSLTNCTISFWRKKTTAGGWLLLRGQTNSHYVMATSSGTGAFYHSNAGTSWQIFVDGVIRATPIDDTNWHHYVMRNVDLSTWTELTLNNYSSWYFRGILDDFRIYNMVLTDDDIKKLYNTRAQVDNKGNFFANNINETGHKPLLMDYTAWVNGTSNSTAGNMGNYGSQNRIVIGSDPWGKEIPLWESYGIDNTTTNSGIYGYYNSIDNTKLYRMSWWEKRISNGNATYGRYYAGLNGSPSGVWNLSSDTYNTNPYFWSTSRTGLPIGEWFLVVGHVWPHTYTGGVNHQDSGRWSLDGNKIGGISYDFRSGPETTTLRSRTLSIYQGNDGGLLHHTAYPRFDLCDGSEPTIDELLSGFDSNYIEYVREKGGTAGISLNIGEKDSYFGEINEIGMPVRYIRETMVGSSANAGNHWVEIQAYNSNGINVALGKTAVSSILTDGNTASSPYYSTGPATVDLGNVYIVDYLKIWHYYADARRYYDIKTEVSTDNINWTTVFDSNIDGEYTETSAGKEIPLKPKSFRIGKSNVYVNEINETL